MLPATGEPQFEAEGWVERWILKSVGILRIAQYATPLPTLVVQSTARFDTSAAVSIGCYLIATCWSALIFIHALRDVRRTITPRTAALDVLLICAIQAAIAVIIGPAWTTWQNWTYGPAIGATFLALLYRPGRAGLVLAMLPVLAYGVIPPVVAAEQQTSLNIPDLLSGVGGMVIFAGLGGYVAAVLRHLARTVDHARAAEASAKEREAALLARNEERKKQFRELHDTALTTLEMIAGGVLHDIRAEEVRRRCRRDADYLRGLFMGHNMKSPHLATLLAEVMRDRADLGLRVHPQFDNLPDKIPDAVAEAVTSAVREALNNVTKYAEVREAWLTAVGTPTEGVLVTVADRGRGFDPSTVVESGIMRSIRHRMQEVHGDAAIISAPGQGTVVELSWKR